MKTFFLIVGSISLLAGIGLFFDKTAKLWARGGDSSGELISPREKEFYRYLAVFGLIITGIAELVSFGVLLYAGK